MGKDNPRALSPSGSAKRKIERLQLTSTFITLFFIIPCIFSFKSQSQPRGALFLLCVLILVDFLKFPYLSNSTFFCSLPANLDFFS
jgi:hypothetical protein